MMIKAAGAVFYSLKTKRILLNLRNHAVSKPTCWAFFGGKVNEDEKLKEGLIRELKEEMGSLPDIKDYYIVDDYRSRNMKFLFRSYIIITEEEFIPNINDESGGYGWFNTDHLPKPLHPGARAILKRKSIGKLFVRISEEL